MTWPVPQGQAMTAHFGGEPMIRMRCLGMDVGKSRRESLAREERILGRLDRADRRQQSMISAISPSM